MKKLCSRVIDSLGIAVFACVALTLALPGIMPAQVRAMVAVPSDSAMASIDYANCLWHTARNQGFYSLQHAVATGTGTEANRQLWIQLVDSIEPSVCGSQDIDISDLIRALEDTTGAADQYFMAMRQY
ncbi:hypothetical protein [Granulosicoccus antarcticus]|nr:hypothetical protein [Granulosicoccus antarcticus]